MTVVSALQLLSAAGLCRTLQNSLRPVPSLNITQQLILYMTKAKSEVVIVELVVHSQFFEHLVWMLPHQLDLCFNVSNYFKNQPQLSIKISSV